MEIEIGKRYVIKKGTFVFSVNLQRKIMFEDDVVVEVRHTHLNKVFFGNIVEISTFGPDYVSDNELEFGIEEVSEEYVKSELPTFIDLFVMGLPTNILNNDNK